MPADLSGRIERDADRLRAAGLPDSFCPMPWIHAYADPTGEVRPCCWYDGSLPGSPNLSTMGDMRDVMNSDGMRSARLEFLSGGTPRQCHGCRQRESSGAYSKRMRGMDSVTDDELSGMSALPADGHLGDFSLRHFDFRFDNTCNFKCRTCGPANSSRIESEVVMRGHPRVTGDFDADRWHLEFMAHLHTARTVYFAGGEPLVMDSHYEILGRLCDLGMTDVPISLSTNLSQLSRHGRAALDLWKRFTDIRVSISLDHHGDRAAYIRHGTDWDAIVSNYRLLRSSCPHAAVQIDCVVSVLNIMDITDIIDRFGMTFDASPVNLLPVMGKPYMDPRNLPHDLKTEASSRIRRWCASNPHSDGMVRMLHALVDGMSAPATPGSEQKLVRYMRELDAMRGEKFEDALPELARGYGL